MTAEQWLECSKTWDLRVSTMTTIDMHAHFLPDF